MKNLIIVFCSIFLLTACSDFNVTPQESPDHDSHEHEKVVASNCSEKDKLCEGPSCGDLNCANCENKSCENKLNPGARCGCGKDKTKTTSPAETTKLQTNIITEVESDGHDHDHEAMNTFDEPSQEIAEDAIVRTISINAKRFEFSPNVIRIKKGETIKIKVQNIDMIHNITIPEFKIGNKEEALFTATETGTFKFFCANMCGRDHHDMEGTIIVE